MAKNTKFSIKEWQNYQITEVTAVVDTDDPKSPILKKLLKKHKVTMARAPGFGKVKLTGSRKDMEAVLQSEDGWGINDLHNYIEETKMAKNTKFSIKEWQDNYLNEGASHPKDVVKSNDFEKFANQISAAGWEFTNFPKKYAALLDKKSEDGEVAYDQVTGVENYQDFENFVVHYVTDGTEDWYLLVSMTGKSEAVKGAPKFKTI